MINVVKQLATETNALRAYTDDTNTKIKIAEIARALQRLQISILQNKNPSPANSAAGNETAAALASLSEKLEALRSEFLAGATNLDADEKFSALSNLFSEARRAASGGSAGSAAAVVAKWPHGAAPTTNAGIPAPNAPAPNAPAPNAPAPNAPAPNAPAPNAPRAPEPPHIVIVRKKNSAIELFAWVIIFAVLGAGGYFGYPYLRDYLNNATQPPAQIATGVPVDAPPTGMPITEDTPDESPAPAPETPDDTAPPPEEIEEEKPIEIDTTKEHKETIKNVHETLPTYTSRTVTSTSTKPPLPPLSLRNTAYEELRDATLARIKDGRWNEHIEQLANYIRAISLKKVRGAKPSQNLLADEFRLKTFPLALVQFSLFSRIDPTQLHALCDKHRAFAQRTFLDTAALEKFAIALAPEDNLLRALDIWATLDAKEKTPAERARYQNLAMAIALVYDSGAGTQLGSNRVFAGDTKAARASLDDIKIIGETAPEKVYSYYREIHRLDKTPFSRYDDVLPDELAFAVAPTGEESEYIWLVNDNRWQKRDAKGDVNGFKKNSKWGRLAASYGVISYQSVTGPQNTLHDILANGGICMHQTRFSHAYIRAHGVPAAAFGGVEPNEVGHAWTAFRDKNGWRTTGRLQADASNSRNPQTGRGITESHLYLYNNKDRKSERRALAHRFFRLASLLTEEERVTALESAILTYAKEPKFWETFLYFWCEQKKQNGGKMPTEELKKYIRDFHYHFTGLPDFFDITDKIEIAYLLPNLDPAQTELFLKLREVELKKKYGNRFDLYIRNVARITDFYIKRQRPNTARSTLYPIVQKNVGRGTRDFKRIFNLLESIIDKNPDFPHAGDIAARFFSLYKGGPIPRRFVRSQFKASDMPGIAPRLMKLKLQTQLYQRFERLLEKTKSPQTAADARLRAKRYAENVAVMEEAIALYRDKQSGVAKKRRVVNGGNPERKSTGSSATPINNRQ